MADPKKGSNGTPPISDKGSAAPGPARDADAILLERPLELTRQDIERLQTKHGLEKANEKIRDAVNPALRGVKVTVDRRQRQ